VSKNSEVMHSSHWGAFVADVEDGALAGIRPLASDPDPSPLISSIQDALTSGARVAAPSVRAGWLAHGPGARSHERGGDHFVEVSWEHALDLVAGELKRVRDDYGNAAIFGGSYGWSSAGRFHHAKSQLARFLNSFGGCTDQIGNYSYAAASAILPHILGDDAATTGDVTSWGSIVGNSRLCVMFGGAPLKNAQVEAGGTSRHGARDALLRARQAGVEFVGITPLRDDLPEFLNAEWIAPRPNTDTAIMLGLAHVLISEDLHDEDFLTQYCVGWPRLRDYITGAADGTVKSAEWAAAIADVDADQLRRLARRMAETRTLITATWSLQRADHGEQPFWMAIALAAILGQIGLPGGGFGFAYADAAGIGNPKSPFGTPSFPIGLNPARSSIPVARISDMMLGPGQEYDFNGKRLRYPDIRLVYWAGGNPFHHHQDINRLIDAWRRPETIIVHEPWWTATARHADIVLPATTTLERNDIGAATRDRTIIAMHQAVEPVGMARNDYDIFSDLAARLSVHEEYTQGLDEQGWLRRIYQTFCERAASNAVELPSFDQFWQEGALELPVRADRVLLEEFRTDPGAHPLATPSGRIEVFSETIDGFGYPDCPGHPVWLEPSEWLGSPTADRFPLHLISNQPKTRLHGQLDMARVSADSKVAGREPARLNPADAAARDISDGDVIVIANDRGSCLAGARLDSAVRVGVMQLATGAWYDPLDKGTIGTLDKHGNPNVLTADHGTSMLGQGPSAHSALVEVARYRENLPEITAFAQPAFGNPDEETQRERSS
jgi:biotin/methionine sulfoxide reductase